MKLPTLPSWAGTVLRALPWVLIAAAYAAIYLAHGKIDSLEGQLAARKAEVGTLTVQRDFFRTAVTQRDELLRRQSDSIQALADAAQVDRTNYLAGIKAAQKVSADHQKAASELLALTAPDGEVAQCRAARDLLERELVQ